MKFQTPEVSGRRPLKIELRLRARPPPLSDIQRQQGGGQYLVEEGRGEYHLGAHTDTWQ